jgi:hypothetical protein
MDTGTDKELGCRFFFYRRQREKQSRRREPLRKLCALIFSAVKKASIRMRNWLARIPRLKNILVKKLSNHSSVIFVRHFKISPAILRLMTTFIRSCSAIILFAVTELLAK